MFDAAECVFLYLEAGLRVGSGEASLTADVPTQREPATGYPVLPASSLKGSLRNQARLQQATPELLSLLGSLPDSDDKQPSWIVLSDALPLLFPVRSLRGLFAWVASAEIWSRFQRDVTAYGVKGLKPPPLPALPPETAGVRARCSLSHQQADPGAGGDELSRPGFAGDGRPGRLARRNRLSRRPGLRLLAATSGPGDRFAPRGRLSLFRGAQHPRRPAHSH